MTFTGKPGDRFMLLRSPAVLTHFDGPGLRLTKREIPGHGLVYVASVPNSVSAEQLLDEVSDANEQVEVDQTKQYTAKFEYQLEALNLKHIPVLTGMATVSQIDVTVNESGWQIESDNAVRIEAVASDQDASTRAKVLLGLGHASLVLQPKARDVAAEETKFFVEASNLYLPGPGVINGRHRLHIRTSQGQISQLTVQIPMGLTVSNVDGPIGSWQFDADSGRLELQLEPAQSQAFHVTIETQRGLDPLPVDTKLAPVTVDNANGQVGLLAIAFGSDAQPETATPTTMSAVNLGDFDSSMLDGNVTLHRVFRYGADSGELALRVAPVDPEVRIVSKQVLSLGDERIVLAVNFVAAISRAGLFQLSLPLPDGLEVESLTGTALDHWSEIQENGQRRVVLHLNGKTIGTCNFAVTLTGPAPTNAESWIIPRFQVSEANRQTGELVIRPTTRNSTANFAASKRVGDRPANRGRQCEWCVGVSFAAKRLGFTAGNRET